jgi:hypothetical protein
LDLSGRKIDVLLDDIVFGKQSLHWEGFNTDGAKLSSGLYFISIQSETNRQTIKVLLE